MLARGLFRVPLLLGLGGELLGSLLHLPCDLEALVHPCLELRLALQHRRFEELEFLLQLGSTSWLTALSISSVIAGVGGAAAFVGAIAAAAAAGAVVGSPNAMTWMVGICPGGPVVGD